MEPPFMPEVSYHIPKEEYGVHEVIEHSGTLEEEITSVLHDKNPNIRGLKQLASVRAVRGMAAMPATPVTSVMRTKTYICRDRERPCRDKPS